MRKTKGNVAAPKIVELYSEGKGNTTIAKLLNISPMCVWETLKRHGIKTKPKGRYREYKIDESYFESIDTEDKAYFLGLLYADGCASSHKQCITIALQEDDIDILQKFNSCIKSENPLLKLNNTRGEPYKQQYRLCIYSKKMYEDVIKLGCIPNKSYYLEFPTENQVPKELVRHFIRGYFDGDGSVYILNKERKNPRTVVSFCGNSVFIIGLLRYVSNILPVDNTKPYVKKTKNTENMSIRFSSKKDVKLLYTYMYTNAEYYLKRKKEKFNENGMICVISSF